MLVDTHAHLYLDVFAGDIDNIIDRAEKENVKKIFLPAIDSSTLNAMLALEDKYSNVCSAMIGLHPCSVKENYKKELSVVHDCLSKRKFAAIGEIGLDFYWDKTFINEQYEVLRIQIEWALQYELPVILHTRNATPETINIINEYVPKGVRGIFHCFSGNYEEAKAIIRAGFYLGIGGVVTYKNAGLAEVLEKIGLEYMVLETDAPYLTPLPYRGKRNESSYLKYIAEKIAVIKNIPVEKVAEITSGNAETVFGISF